MKWIILVEFGSVYDTIEVEADTEQEAFEIASQQVDPNAIERISPA